MNKAIGFIKENGIERAEYIEKDLLESTNLYEGHYGLMLCILGIPGTTDDERKYPIYPEEAMDYFCGEKKLEDLHTETVRLKKEKVEEVQIREEFLYV